MWKVLSALLQSLGKDITEKEIVVFIPMIRQGFSLKVILLIRSKGIEYFIW